MKKSFYIKNIINISSIVKVLFIFLIGLVSRILIYHYLGVNVFSEYTSCISILYYFGMSSFSVYYDQLFSFHLASPNVEFFDIKQFNIDYKTGNLLLTKDHNNQSPIHHPLHHKVRCKLS
jgi:hypothetical protein